MPAAYAAPATEAEVRMANENFFAMLDAGQVKQAVDGVNDYTRTKMRETGFINEIIEALPISNDQLDRQQDTEEPIKIVDFEPNSPPAISVPFGGPNTYNVYIRGDRYAVGFARLMTPKFIKDVVQLRTWTMDIRSVLSDNSIKDMLAFKDAQFVNSALALMSGPGVPLPFNNNQPMWEEIEAPISRASWQDARKIMPRGYARLESTTALMNNITIKEFEKFGRDEMGGDLSQDVFKDGWAETKLSKVRIIITIKQEIVPEDRVMFWAEPKWLGKHYQLEQPTMYVDAKAYMIEFFTYESLGQSLVGGVAMADFV